MNDKVENNKTQSEQTENTAGGKRKTKKKKVTYDELFKGYMDELPDEIVKKFLFFLFGLNVEMAGELVRLQQETYNDKQKRVCDLFYRIGDFFFCIELQLINDKYMAIRVFEYSFRGAMLHGISESTDSHVTITFPEPAVIYLQNSGKTPDKITINLNFSGNTVQYEAKVRKLADYGVDDLFEQYAFPLMAFYPLKYLNALKKKHTAAVEKKFIRDISKIIERLCKAAEEVIEPVMAQDIIDSLISLMYDVCENGGLIADKEVLINMEQFRTIEVNDYSEYYEMRKKMKNEVKSECISEGKTEERKKIILRMTANGFTPANIAKQVDMTTAEVRKIISENKKEINSMPKEIKAKSDKKTTKRTSKKADE